jgi:pyruvate dehydrogenase E1 component alpha subunit
MMAELYGKATGYSSGKSGSMHIADIGLGIIGANGIVGAAIAVANGVAFANKYRGSDAVTVAFFGDGSTNRGTFHEALNLASTWDLPIIFVCENNKFGMSTSTDRSMNVKRISERAAAYGMTGVTVDGNDPVAVKGAVHDAIARIRKGKGQTLIECLTWRHHGHFIGDPAPYKDPDEQKLWLSPEKDPILRFEALLTGIGMAQENELESIREKIRNEVLAAIDFAEASAEPLPESLLENVYVD